MTLREQAITGVVWSGIQRWGARICGLIVFFILARLLGPEEFGLIALAGVFIAFADVFISQGFTQALIQREVLEPEHLDTAFWVGIAAGLFMTLLAIVVAPLLARLTTEPTLTPVIRWLSLSFILSALSSVQDAVLQRAFNYKSLAVRHLLGVTAGGMIGVTMAYWGYGVWSLVVQQLVASLVSTVVLWRSSSWRPRLKLKSRHFRDLFSFEVNLLVSRILNLVNRRADDFLIGFFRNATALGFYSVAYRLYYIVEEMTVSALAAVSFASFSRMQEDKERLQRNFYKVVRFTSAVASPAFIGLGVVAPEVVTLIFGQAWQPSIPVLQVLVFMGILQSAALYNFAILKALGKTRWEMYITALYAVANLVGFLIAVPLGITAVAAAYVICGYLLAPLALIAVRRLTGISFRIYFRQFVGPIASSLLMAASIFGVKNFLRDYPLLFQVTGYVLLGSVVYIAALRVVAPNLVTDIVALVRKASFRSSPVEAKAS